MFTDIYLIGTSNSIKKGSISLALATLCEDFGLQFHNYSLGGCSSRYGLHTLLSRPIQKGQPVFLDFCVNDELFSAIGRRSRSDCQEDFEMLLDMVRTNHHPYLIITPARGYWNGEDSTADFQRSLARKHGVEVIDVSEPIQQLSQTMGLGLDCFFEDRFHPFPVVAYETVYKKAVSKLFGGSLAVRKVQSQQGFSVSTSLLKDEGWTFKTGHAIRLEGFQPRSILISTQTNCWLQFSGDKGLLPSMLVAYGGKPGKLCVDLPEGEIDEIVVSEVPSGNEVVAHLSKAELADKPIEFCLFSLLGKQSEVEINFFAIRQSLERNSLFQLKSASYFIASERFTDARKALDRIQTEDDKQLSDRAALYRRLATFEKR